MDPVALASFLRSRRDALHPGDVGLPAGSRRRVQGLRREEVAQLASMSVDYYARLERGSGAQPSTSILDVLARVLRLTLDEREHVYLLAGYNAPDRITGSPHVAPGLQRILGLLSSTPAFVVSDLAETLAQSPLADALFGDPSRHVGNDRSGIYRWFMRPEERLVYPVEDRARQGRSLVASLRAAVGRQGPRSAAATLARELERRSPEFAGWWQRQEVARRFEDHKTLIHPEVGAIRFDCQALFTEDRSQTLVVLTVTPRTEDEEKLRLLAVLGLSRFATAESPMRDSYRGGQSASE